MTKTEAIEAMQMGLKVTHQYFTSEEYVCKTGDLYQFEDGCLCDYEEFWQYRQEAGWDYNWKIFTV